MKEWIEDVFVVVVQTLAIVVFAAMPLWLGLLADLVHPYWQIWFGP